jgi:hypothetical protein
VVAPPDGFLAPNDNGALATLDPRTKGARRRHYLKTAINMSLRSGNDKTRYAPMAFDSMLTVLDSAIEHLLSLGLHRDQNPTV